MGRACAQSTLGARMRSLHLDHDGSLTCTHSVAECVTAIAAGAHLAGADYVRVTWDSKSSHVAINTVPYPDTAWQLAITYAMQDHDPFQSGENTTMPTWYVGRQLAIVLGTTVDSVGAHNA